MSTKAKKKLCWNCEGNVALQDELCPYCGVSLNVTPIAGTGGKDLHFNPPYRLSSLTDSLIPPAPYANHQQEEEEEEEKDPPPSTEEPEKDNNELTSIAIPLSLALLGTVLVLFSLLLLLFSDSNGVFTLHWKGSYWFVYLLIGLPLLYFGWKAAAPIQEQNEN